MNKYIVINSDNAIYEDNDYIKQLILMTGKIHKTSDIFRILPFIMEKVEKLKEAKKMTNEETKLLTILLVKKIVLLSENPEKTCNVIHAFVDNNLSELVEILIKCSKNEYMFNRKIPWYRRIFNWINFVRAMSTFQTGAEIALL